MADAIFSTDYAFSYWSLGFRLTVGTLTIACWRLLDWFDRFQFLSVGPAVGQSGIVEICAFRLRRGVGLQQQRRSGRSTGHWHRHPVVRSPESGPSAHSQLSIAVLAFSTNVQRRQRQCPTAQIEPRPFARGMPYFCSASYVPSRTLHAEPSIGRETCGQTFHAKMKPDVSVGLLNLRNGFLHKVNRNEFERAAFARNCLSA